MLPLHRKKGPISINFKKIGTMEKNNYLTAREAAHYVGIALSYLYKLTSRKEIPFYRPLGRRILFAAEDLDKWVRSGRVASNEELQEQAQNNITLAQRGGVQ